MKSSFVPHNFFQNFFFQDQDSTMKFNKKVMLYILKMPTKVSVVPQGFCRNQNSVEDQEQDQNHDFTSDFNTRTTFYDIDTFIHFVWIRHSLTTYKHTDSWKFFFPFFEF